MDQRLLRILGGNKDKYPHHLESRYPRVFGKIMSLWDSPDIEAYFMELMVDTRGDRAGFPPEVAAEILHISLVHASQHPSSLKQDIWSVSTDSFADFSAPTLPADTSAWHEPPDAIRFSLERSGVPCTQEGFLRAAEDGNRAAVALFLEAREYTEIRDERGWTALMRAAFNGRDEVVALLIEQAADANSTDLGGNSALHWAAFSGHAGCAKYLLEHGAHSDERNNFGLTPLLQATAHRHLDVVSVLIDKGANLDAYGSDGWTSLHKAVALGHTEIVSALLHNGANMSIKNKEGDTPVKLAMKNKQDQVMKLFLSVNQADIATR